MTGTATRMSRLQAATIANVIEVKDEFFEVQ